MRKITCKAITFLGIILLFGPTLSSQIGGSIRFTKVNNSEELPNNSINCIVKDDLGFIWIGTKDGLCRYEGTNTIKTYKVNSPPIEGGLESSNIRVLFLDSQQNLWIGTRLGGLTRFHQSSNTWRTFRHDDQDTTSLCNDEILAITEDRNGRIWVGTEDGLSVYFKETDTFFTFKKGDDESGSLQGKAVLSILEDASGRIWVGTWEGGLSLLKVPENGHLEDAKFQTFYPSEKKQASRVWDIYQDNQQNYWLGTAAGGLFLMRLPEQSNQTIEADWTPHFYNFSNDGSTNSITNDDIKDILQDRNGKLWIATTNGLCSVDAETLTSFTLNPTINKLEFNQYFNEYDNNNSIAHNYVRALFEDDQGIIWAGTQGGLSQYNWANNQFDVHEFATDLTKDPVSQNLYVDPSGVAWIGNGVKGILKYDVNKGQKLKNVNLGLSNCFISSLYSPDDEQLYFGHNNGVCVLEMKTNKLRHYPILNASHQQERYSSIRSLYKDKQHRIWLGTENGLFVIDDKTGQYKQYLTNYEEPKAISDNTINQIVEDHNGTVWLATYQGLNKVSENDNGELEFEHFKHDATNPDNSIASNRVVSIVVLNDILYLATTNGLSGYDLNQKTFTNYSKDNNKHSFQSLDKAKDGNLWGSTTEGIVLYNVQTNTFNKYEKRDGLGSGAFRQRSSFIDKNGLFYLGSQRGITRFDPLSIKTNETPPPVHVTDIRTMSPDGEKLNNATYRSEVVLDHDDYYLSIDYAAINYNRSEKNQYAFMLEGFDDKWNFIDKKIPAVYTNLRHGSYKFKVKAANNDGVWNEEGTTLSIIKKPAYWETWQFRIGSVISSILLLFFGVKYYTRSISARNEILQQYNVDLNKEITQRKIAESALQQQKLDLKESNKDLERSNKDLEQFAYIASHDLQEPLRVVGNFIGLLKHRYSDQFDQDAHQYLDFIVSGVGRMSQQIKSILTFSRVIQNQISIGKIDLNNIVQLNLHDLSQIIEKKQCDIKIDVLPEIVGDENLIRIVFHNLIHNAIKFNKNETPQISIHHLAESPQGYWQFAVKDNGIGIHKDHQEKIFEIFKRLHSKDDYEGTGIGLALCNRIIHRHGGEITLESQEGVGTTFYFTISKNLIPKHIS